MLTNLFFPAGALLIFVYYKYSVFSRRHISTGDRSPKLFLRFWLRSPGVSGGWQEFKDGKGEFSCQDASAQENHTYGGGICGSW